MEIIGIALKAQPSAYPWKSWCIFKRCTEHSSWNTHPQLTCVSLA